MGAALGPACGCNGKCCGDEIRAQASGDLPGLPSAESGPGFPDISQLPKGVAAVEAKGSDASPADASVVKQGSDASPTDASAVKLVAPNTEASVPIVVERRWGKPAKLVGLEIGFLLPDGSERTISFGGIPGWPGTKLGLEFHPTKPCTVKVVHPAGFGEKLGVQKDWIVQYVNGDRVVGEEVDYVFELMKRALAEAAQAQAGEAP